MLVSLALRAVSMQPPKVPFFVGVIICIVRLLLIIAFAAFFVGEFNPVFMIIGECLKYYGIEYMQECLKYYGIGYMQVSFILTSVTMLFSLLKVIPTLFMSLILVFDCLCFVDFLIKYPQMMQHMYENQFDESLLIRPAVDIICVFLTSLAYVLLMIFNRCTREREEGLDDPGMEGWQQYDPLLPAID
ncbi:hypothetical protein QR680_006771 [Steinernema hermaphroditum]|uniref:Uncharacterized protein n=1 Tax=Steinernema hermaphroditum TaxID=289476 RepID=A0AA39LX21_9BILA|nr:hypothetical protein QR680_006771 [Steinernema hermaphroditum]